MAEIGSTKPSILSQPPPNNLSSTDFRPVDKAFIDTAKDMFSAVSNFMPISSAAKFAVNLGFFTGRVWNEDTRTMKHNETLRPQLLEARSQAEGLEIIGRHNEEHATLGKDVMFNHAETLYDGAKDGVDAFQFLRKTPVLNKVFVATDIGVELCKTASSGKELNDKRVSLRDHEREIARRGGIPTEEQNQKLETLKKDYFESKAKFQSQTLDSTMNSAKSLAKLSPHATAVEISVFVGKGMITGYKNYDPAVGLPKPDFGNQFE